MVVDVLGWIWRDNHYMLNHLGHHMFVHYVKARDKHKHWSEGGVKDWMWPLPTQLASKLDDY